jgi:hypothetical protein
MSNVRIRGDECLGHGGGIAVEQKHGTVGWIG